MSDEKAYGRKLIVANQTTAAPVPNHQLSTLNPQPPLSPNQRAWQRFRRNRPAAISTWFLAVVVLIVIAWPIVLKVASLTGPRGAAFSQNYQPEKLSEQQFQPPSPRHWFGTDVHGRDLL